jgi:uracil-DNA glycosylase
MSDRPQPDERDDAMETLAQVRMHLERLRDRGTMWVPVADVAPLAVAAGPPPAPSVSPLQLVRDELGECTRCKLAKGRKNIVFGVGNPEADLVFVGEAPGLHEDLQGEPFVGDAGQLLTRMIEAMGYRRQDVHILNVLKCRPPGNRNPEADEIEQCVPFLKKQLEALRPRILVALGKFAAQFLCGKPDAPISALRGRFHVYQGVQVMPTYHPAYLLRTPSQKRVVWEDLQLVMRELERLGVGPGVARAG